MVPIASEYDVTHYRLYEDDAALGSMTPYAAEDTGWDGPAEDATTKFVLHIQIADTLNGDTASTNEVSQLQYKVNAGSWVNVTGASAVIRASASSNFADDDNCPDTLTDTYSNSSFQSLGADEVDGENADLGLGGDTRHEMAFSLEYVASSASEDDVITFQLTRSDIAAHNVTPTITIAAAAPSTPVYTQAKFRGRNNDGSETGASWIAVADTDWENYSNSVFRARFLIQCTVAGAAGQAFDIQYRHDDGGGYGAWTDISATSSVVRARNTGNLTEGDDTTDQGLGSGTFTADNNGVVEGDSISDAMTTVVNEEFDLEYALSIRSADVGHGDKIQLRVALAGVALDTYTATPTITVLRGDPPPPPSGGSGRNDNARKRGYTMGMQPCKTAGRTWKPYRGF